MKGGKMKKRKKNKHNCMFLERIENVFVCMSKKCRKTFPDPKEKGFVHKLPPKTRLIKLE